MAFGLAAGVVLGLAPSVEGELATRPPSSEERARLLGAARDDRFAGDGPRAGARRAGTVWERERPAGEVSEASLKPVHS